MYILCLAMAEPKLVKFQIHLPEDLRTQFKAECVLEGVTMNEIAIELIRGWLKEKAKHERAR